MSLPPRWTVWLGATCTGLEKLVGRQPMHEQDECM